MPPVVVEPEVFDANAYRSAANYIYSRVAGHIRVQVQNVEGIADSNDESNPLDVQRNGYYYRTANIIDPGNPGWTSRTVGGYLCLNNNAPSRRDETNGECLVQLGHGFSAGAALVEYRNGTWTFNGNHHAPGVVLVEGDTVISNGTYTNTFIATGNLTVPGAGGAVFALNYAGPHAITVEGHTALGVCNNTQYRLRPEAFCESTYKHTAHGGLGNYALMAGSCPAGSENGCSRNAYMGGDIRVERSVFGVTRAGNLFSSAGNARLYGYVSALAQRNNASTVNEMSASTLIDLRIPDEALQHYDPSGGLLPPAGGSNERHPPTGATPGSAELLWGRYL